MSGSTALVRTMQHLRSIWLTLKAVKWRLGTFVAFLAIGGYLWKQHISVPQEERVAQVLREAKSAIEMKQYGKLMRLISVNYHDSTGTTYRDIKDAVQSYMKDQNLSAKIDILALVVYVRRNTAVADVRLQVTLTVGEHSYTIRPSGLTIFLQKEFIKWRIVTVEGWQRGLSELPIDDFVH
ncbi:MAG: hypothetical protein GDYSWBUE_001020 [Candidatus Fervidibacterota bacterium]